ncbi:unnamed protein product [Brassica napus]|uniref:(rape) hypothetical protein n=1 Tax=Brassica napus TaxID=3708 RepID=A0A816K1R7_BRANA|nr:unnamed protein product [Brassica napus]
MPLIATGVTLAAVLPGSRWIAQILSLIGIQDRSFIGSHDPSRPKLFIFIGTSNFFPQRMKMESCKMFIGRLSWKTTEYREYFRVSVSVAVRAILLIHVIDRLLLLQVKLSFYSFLFLPMFFCIFAKGEPGYLSTPCHELASTLIQKQLQDSVTMRGQRWHSCANNINKSVDVPCTGNVMGIQSDNGWCYLHSPALDVVNQMLLVSSAEINDVVFVVDRFSKTLGQLGYASSLLDSSSKATSCKTNILPTIQ